MDEDTRLNTQLKSLGKKLFQFRDLIAKLEIPETLPPAPHDAQFWESFVTKCSSAVTVLRQVQAALTPDMYHLAVFPGEKVWRNPAAVPDLLGLPERIGTESPNPIASHREEIQAWNTRIDEANRVIGQLLEFSSLTTISTARTSVKPPPAPADITGAELITTLFTTTSRERLTRPL
jgi:hypothetical protein